MHLLPPDPRSLSLALDIINRGGIVAHATETCYGLACDMRNPDAVLRLFKIKHRDPKLPVSGLFASVEKAKKWVQWSDVADTLARDYLPGPLTLVLFIRDDVPQIFPVPKAESTKSQRNDQAQKNQSTLRPGSGQANQLINPSLGVRISPHPVALALAESLDFPISTTSANIHGFPNCYSPSGLIDQFTRGGDGPDLILDSGTLPPTPPSTVMDLTADTAKVIRQGSLLPSKGGTRL